MKKGTIAKITASIILGGLSILGLRSCGEEVYNGSIDGMDVVYEENLFSGGFGRSDFLIDGKNQMTLVDEKGIEYRLIDSTSETNINWRNKSKPDFEKDRLEVVVIRERDGEDKITYDKRTYKIPSNFVLDDGWNSWSPDLIAEQHKKDVFVRCNALYNHLRGRIREELRNGYETEHDKITEAIPAKE